MNLHPVKAVVFDLGKVLVDFDYEIAKRRILGRSDHAHDEVMKSLENSEILVRYEKGRLTSEEFYQIVRERSGFDGSYEEFGEAFSDIFTPIDSMIDLFRSIRKSSFRTFIFSNTNELAIRHISASFDFYNQFEGHILSYEHGFMKPESQLYEAVERMSGSEGAEIVYIDDRHENIEAGKRRGWKTVLQETPGRTRAAFDDLGLI